MAWTEELYQVSYPRTTTYTRPAEADIRISKQIRLVLFCMLFMGKQMINNNVTTKYSIENVTIP